MRCPDAGLIVEGYSAGNSAGGNSTFSRGQEGVVVTKDGQQRMLDQLQPSTHDQFISPTGLRVRQDLYDEDYSDEDYEQMLSMYEGTMAQIVEGEIVKSKVLRVTDNAVILDVGFKSEGSVPLDEFKDPQSLKEGDEVEVFLEHLEDQEGAVVHRGRCRRGGLADPQHFGTCFQARCSQRLQQALYPRECREDPRALGPAGSGGRGGWLRLRVTADDFGGVRDQLPGRVDHRRFFFYGQPAL